MASQHLSIELTAGSGADVLPTTYGPTIALRGTGGDSVWIHLGSIRLDGDERRADALAALDTLVAAVQAAMLTLAPERFPQPEPEPTPDPEPCGCSADPDWHHHPADTTPADRPMVVAQAHPMTENELRALAGDR